MSREEFRRGRWLLAVGVDHATGAFVQLWLSADQDVPTAQADSLGVQVYPPEILMDDKQIPVRFARFIRNMVKRFDQWRITHPKGPLPNLGRDDVVNFVKSFDPAWGEELAMDIYRIMD